MRPKPFVFVKISDYGTSAPVVARTTLQAQCLKGLFPLPEGLDRRIFEVMFEVQRRLLECFKIAEKVRGEIQRAVDDFSASTEGSSQEAPSHPWVVDLERDVESFLYQAKLALRDIGAELDLFFGQNFAHRWDRALQWAERRFGPSDPLTECIRAHYQWIPEIIDRRNAVEHPTDQPRGRLHVQNFAGNYRVSPPRLREPTWHLTDEPPASIAEELPAIVECLLRLAEEVYATSLIKQETPIAVEIVEIPEAERDSAAPVRLKVRSVNPPAV